MPPCPGGAWFIRADVLDAEVWARVEEMASDTEQFQRMIMAPLHEAQAKLGQIEQQEKTIADELEQARKDRDTISRRMATEEDDAIAATYRVRMKETLQLITRLEARMGSQDRTSERLRAYLDVMAAAMSVDDGEGEWGIYNPATGETTPIAPPPIAPRPRTYTREQRRNLLRAIGVRVLIYSTKSDYARDNGKRWDMQIIPELYAQESMQKYIMRQTAIDELGLEAAASVQTA
jgi:F0F1-type ATP synthase membrane subunit b/b'